VVILVILAGVVTVVTLVLTGHTVVPGLSERIFPVHYEEDIALAAQKYGQDPYLVAAVVKAESGYDSEAVSRVGAVGLMQVMPDTAAWIVGELSLWQGDADVDLLDPSDNLELGACYLAYLGQTFGEGTQLTLAAYNAGPGTVAEWIEAAGGQEEFDLADIRFPETRHYVERVEHYRLLYMRIHPDVFDTAGISNPAEGSGGTGLGWGRGVLIAAVENERLP
jgi:soluble lytic murein transglycosylase